MDAREIFLDELKKLGAAGLIASAATKIPGLVRTALPAAKNLAGQVGGQVAADKAVGAMQGTQGRPNA